MVVQELGKVFNEGAQFRARLIGKFDAPPKDNDSYMIGTMRCYDIFTFVSHPACMWSVAMLHLQAHCSCLMVDLHRAIFPAVTCG
jgi:hypothetical protein